MNFKIGDILNGKVIKLIKIGAFVEIGEEKTGFVHISEITHSFINFPSDVLRVGDLVDAKVISVDDGKIKLSIKQVNDKKNNKNKQDLKDFGARREAKTNDFEDMMKKFKTSSEQKLSDLKKHINNKQGSKQRRR